MLGEPRGEDGNGSPVDLASALRCLSERLRCERGSIWIIAAFFVPVLILLGTFAVDVGNWFTHKRHLQTQADAAAFAGGSQWAINCTAAVNQAIIDTARQYAGPSASNPTALFNPQVSGTPSSNLHVVLNSTNYFENGGTDFDGDAVANAPCNLGYLDVKVSEQDLPWFFDFFKTGPVKWMHAQARVKLVQLQAVSGQLPLGIPTPQIFQAQARITKCVGGAKITSADEIVLKKLPDNLQTSPGMTLWAPDPTVYPGYAVPIALGGASPCAGTDYAGIDVNVQVSGSPFVTPSLVPSTCGNRFVDCFDTAMVRVYTDPTGLATTPTFGNVRLLDVNCGPGTPYWSSGYATTLPCTFNATANVNWGTPLSTLTGFSGSLTMTVGGSQQTVSNITANQAVNFNNLFSSGDGTTGPQNATISWSWAATGGRWGNKTCRSNNPCTDSSSSPVVVHRANAGATNPIVKVLVTDPATGFPIDSVSSGSVPSSVSLVVGLESQIKVGERRILRADQSQGNQTLQCDPDYSNGFDVTVFALGCKPLYAPNSLAAGPWEPCPTPTNQWYKYPQGDPWQCALAGPGLSPNQVADAAAIRTGNCTSIQYTGAPPLPKSCSAVACNHPNYWSQYGTGSATDPAVNSRDPRIVTLFVVPYGAFNTTNANDPVEVVELAKFYITGWKGQGGGGSNNDPCLTFNPPDEALTTPGTVVGRFISSVDFFRGIPNPTVNCDPTSPIPCKVVLIK